MALDLQFRVNAEERRGQESSILLQFFHVYLEGCFASLDDCG